MNAGIDLVPRVLGELVQNLLQSELALSVRKILRCGVQTMAEIFPIRSTKPLDLSLQGLDAFAHGVQSHGSNYLAPLSTGRLETPFQSVSHALRCDPR